MRKPMRSGSTSRRSRTSFATVVLPTPNGPFSHSTVSSDTAEHGRTVAVGLLAKLRAYATVLPRANRNRTEIARLYARRPALGLGVGAMETAALVSGRVDIRLKALASLKTSSRVGCPF